MCITPKSHAESILKWFSRMCLCGLNLRILCSRRKLHFSQWLLHQNGYWFVERAIDLLMLNRGCHVYMIYVVYIYINMYTVCMLSAYIYNI